MKAKDWRDKSAGERAKTLQSLSDAKRKLRFDLATREAKNHAEYRKNRKDIARILTLQNEEKKVKIVAEPSNQS